MKLHEKAAHYEAAIRERHLFEGLLLPWVVLPPQGLPDSSTGNYENCAIWGSAYMCSLAWRMAASKDETIRPLLKESLAAIRRLRTVTGRPDFTARGYKHGLRPTWDEEYFWHGRTHRSEWHQAGQYRWLGDTSSDQLIGVLHGYFMVWRSVADEADKILIRDEVGRLAGHLLDHDMKIIDDDGEITTWGNFNPQLLSTEAWLEDRPLNCLEALAIIKTAYHITGEDRFELKYRELIEQFDYHKYALTAVGHDVPDPNHSDDNLAHLAYQMLFAAETDPVLLDYYWRSYDRMWGYVKPEKNAYFNFVHYALTGRDGDDAGAIESLNGMHPDRRVNELKGNYDYLPEYEHRKGPRHHKHAVPMRKRPEHEYQWAMDPYRYNNWHGEPGAMEFTGTDFLIAYWFGRTLGIISPDA